MFLSRGPSYIGNLVIPEWKALIFCSDLTKFDCSSELSDPTTVFKQERLRNLFFLYLSIPVNTALLSSVSFVRLASREAPFGELSQPLFKGAVSHHSIDLSVKESSQIRVL
jgi:hypothetical protein